MPPLAPVRLGRVPQGGRPGAARGTCASSRADGNGHARQLSLCTLCVSLMGHCRHLSRLSLRVLSVTTVGSNRCSCAKQTSRGRRAGVHEPSPSIGSTCDSGTLRSDCGESKGQVVGLRGWARFDSRSAPGKILIKSSLARAARALCDTLSPLPRQSLSKKKGGRLFRFQAFLDLQVS